MGNPDRFPSYLIESMNNLHHYVNYRGRSYEDLATLQKTIRELNFHRLGCRVIAVFSPDYALRGN